METTWASTLTAVSDSLVPAGKITQDHTQSILCIICSPFQTLEHKFVPFPGFKLATSISNLDDALDRTAMIAANGQSLFSVVYDLKTDFLLEEVCKIKMQKTCLTKSVGKFSTFQMLT